MRPSVVFSDGGGSTYGGGGSGHLIMILPVPDHLSLATAVVEGGCTTVTRRTSHHALYPLHEVIASFHRAIYLCPQSATRERTISYTSTSTIQGLLKGFGIMRSSMSDQTHL